MERSGSQKALKIFGIIYVVIGIIALVIGVLAFLGGGVGASLTADMAYEMSDYGAAAGTALASVGLGVVMVVGIIAIIAGIVDIICGIFGIRAGNDCQKWRGVFVLSIIGIIIGAIQLITTIVVHGNLVSAIISVAWSVLILLLANNVRRQANEQQ